MNSITFCKLLFSCCLIYSVIWASLAQQCPPYERPVECIDQCDSCKWLNKRCVQGAVCIPGCGCFPGWRRDYRNRCIPENQCPGICGPNSQYSDCASLCPPTCNEKPKPCPAVCVEGCVCNPGYINDGNGNCIPENQCPPGPFPPLPPVPFPPVPLPPFPLPPPTNQVCPPNEYPVECINRCQKCEDRKPGCGQSAVCTPGCNCVPGFFRNKQGRCIPEFQCPPLPPGPGFPLPPPTIQLCPLNEYPVECIDRCQKCEDRKGDCAQILICTPGCNCVSNYWRNKQGRCIPEYQCPR